MRTNYISRLLTAVAVVFLLGACKAEPEYSRNYQCHFIFYTQHHPQSVLYGILQNPGVFAKVSVEKRSGINHVLVAPNTGAADEDIALTSAIENDRIYYAMGANNALLIGCTTAMEGVAYDGQCPNCLEANTSTNFPLAWTDNGRALYCDKCKRTYNPNAGGVCTSGGGRALYKYRAYLNTGYDGTEILVASN